MADHATTSLEEFVGRTLKLLEQEREAEIEETRLLQENVSPKELEKRGVCLLRLRIASQHSGMFGRMVLVFEPFYTGKEMPSHNFTPGDIAGLSLSQADNNAAASLASGIVAKVTTSSIHVAFNESQEKLDLDDGAQYKLLKLANDVTYRRLKRALQDLNSYRVGPASNLINVLFGTSTPSPPVDFITSLPGKDLTFLNDRLDESQKEAVRFALSQKELGVIHGPPGTGKTTTVVEILLQAVFLKQKVLVCAPSNIAVDNIVERLAGQGARIVRLGHPARVLPHIQKYSLDAILSTSDETKLVADVRRDMDRTLNKMKKSHDKGERQAMRADLKFLRKELREREDRAVRDLLQRADIVLATLTTAGPDGPLKHLVQEQKLFDLVVIDECSQAMEAACWISLLHGPKCVLAGDHHQLPPTIISHQAAKAGLARTLMERVVETYGATCVRMLTTQYRMHTLIMQWASQQLYEGKLQAHSSVAQHLLRDLPHVEETEETSLPLLLVDTAGCNLQELQASDEVSKGNEGEADLVAAHVQQLIEAGLQATEIAVVTPYNLQVELLRMRLATKYHALEIKSVDGFQGREKEAVVISLVRSNDSGEVGFLAEDRRINVAITRARRHLAVICDTETVSQHAFLKSLVDYMMTHGEVRSAQQYIHGGLELQQFADVDKMSGGTRPKAKQTGAKQKDKRKTKLSQRDKVNVKGQGTLAVSEDQREELNNELQMTRDSIVQQLASFIADPHSSILDFPASLSSRERYIVHEVSEQMGLTHVSQGEGAERHISVSKASHQPQPNTSSKKSVDRPSASPSSSGHYERTTQLEAGEPIRGGGNHKSRYGGAQKESSQKVPDQCQSATGHEQREETASEVSKEGQNKMDHDIPPVNSQNDKHTVPNTSKSSHEVKVSSLQNGKLELRLCPICNKNVPVANYDLHSVRCRVPLTQKQPQQAQLKSAKSKKAKDKKKGESGAVSGGGEEDFDTLIAEAMKANAACAMRKCKGNAATLGQTCEFCGERFCIQHHIPEVHGCGDAARAHARRTIVREGVLYRGSGVPDKRPDADRRAQLERKMEKKKEEMAKKRQRQTKGGK